jgi:23S rRNA G2445 N2-methylase RlmL
MATDFSKQSLAVAKQNTTIDIDFQQGSWFAAVPDKQFDLIISNPPYIEQDEITVNNGIIFFIFSLGFKLRQDSTIIRIIIFKCLNMSKICC